MLHVQDNAGRTTRRMQRITAIIPGVQLSFLSLLLSLSLLSPHDGRNALRYVRRARIFVVHGPFNDPFVDPLMLPRSSLCGGFAKER